MGNGNGKMTGPGAVSAASDVLPGQIAISFLGQEYQTIANAIDWLRDFGGLPRHMASCQCQRCIPARSMVRAAVRDSTCICGWCPVCWARARIQEGRL